MEYIEEHLTDRIDYAVTAKFMNCSECEFRRIFSFIAQVPLSEYIRRRRLTVAATELENGAKIIDTALRYGYESQAAFSRAFRQWHGVSPSQLGTGNKAQILSTPDLQIGFDGGVRNGKKEDRSG